MTTAVRKELGCPAPSPGQGRAGSSCPAQCTVPRHRTREVRAPGATEGQGRAPGGPRGSPADRVPATVEDIAQLQHQQRAAWEGGGSVRPPPPRRAGEGCGSPGGRHRRNVTPGASAHPRAGPSRCCSTWCVKESAWQAPLPHPRAGKHGTSPLAPQSSQAWAGILTLEVVTSKVTTSLAG